MQYHEILIEKESEGGLPLPLHTGFSIFDSYDMKNCELLTIPIFNYPIKVSPDALMAKAFRIRRFGRAELHKTYIQTQVQMKTDGRLNAFNRNGGRSLSNDNLPSPQVVDNITATSTTLTYKAVS